MRLGVIIGAGLAALALAPGPAGCARDPELDSAGFEVVGSSPVDGEGDVISVVVPEVRFSDAADEALCAAATSLDAVADDGEVLFHVEVTPVWSSVSEKLQLEHDIPLNLGYSYALSVRGAASETPATSADVDPGCTSATGEVVAPFFARFRVP